MAASERVQPRLFYVPRQEAFKLAGAMLIILAAALGLRYGVIQNTPVGLACAAGEVSFICNLRGATIGLFTVSLFGTIALVAAAVQFIRPNLTAFSIGLLAAMAGLVLYNTRGSALAVALLILSLARAVPARR